MRPHECLADVPRLLLLWDDSLSADEDRVLGWVDEGRSMPRPLALRPLRNYSLLLLLGIHLADLLLLLLLL